MSNIPTNNVPFFAADAQVPSIEEARRQALALIQARQGRGDLRQHMLQIYGGRCAITGTDIPEVLDVTLIVPSTVDQAYHPANALLLRTDLHTLFLRHLIAIDTATMTVVLSPILRNSNYAELEGRPLRQPFHQYDCPSPWALNLHRSWLQTEIIAPPKERDPGHSSHSQFLSLPSLRARSPRFRGEPVNRLRRAALLPLSSMILQNKSCVNSVCFHPHGNTIAVACWDGLIRLWRLSDAYLINTLDGEIGEVNSVCFSPDGRHIASGGRNCSVQIWRCEDGQLMHSIDGHEGAVFSVACSPDGSLIASGSWDRTVRIWRTSDASPVQILNDHRGAVNCVAFSPDGRAIASASHDRRVRIWSTADGRLLHMLTGHNDAVFSIAYSPDGRFLASAGVDRTIRIWNTADASLLRVLEGHTGAIFSLAYSPGGETLVSGDYDRTVRLWRCEDGALLHEGHQHVEGITTLAYAPDGRHVASGSFDATVRLWHLSTE